MNITIEQYNTVINGLRVQLELQRGVTNEALKEVKTLQELREFDRLEIEKYRKQLKSYHMLTGDVQVLLYNKNKKMYEKFKELLNKHILTVV